MRGEDSDQQEEKDQVVVGNKGVGRKHEKVGAIDLQDAGNPAGDVDRPIEVQQHEVNDLTEPERDDGEVVAT